MLHISFDPFPILETDRLILRKPKEEDADILFQYRSDKEYMRYIPHRYVETKDQVLETLRYIDERIAANEGINWAVTVKGSDNIIGMVGYVKFYADHYRAEVGYMTITPFQNKGYTKEATEAVIKYGFEQLKLHSVEAVVNHENEASKQLLEKMGFTKDAFFKDYLHHGGNFMSANVYSLVKGESLNRQ